MGSMPRTVDSATLLALMSKLLSPPKWDKKSRFPAPSMSRISRAGMYRPASLGVRMSASASCMRATPSGESTEYSLMSGSRVRCFLSGLWNDLIVLVLNSSPSFSATAASRRVAALTLSRSFSAASSAAAAAPVVMGTPPGPTG